MGVPVITKRGDHFLSHLSESIVHNTELSNWIASDEDDYVAKTAKFSSNLDSCYITFEVEDASCIFAAIPYRKIRQSF